MIDYSYSCQQRNEYHAAIFLSPLCDCPSPCPHEKSARAQPLLAGTKYTIVRIILFMCASYTYVRTWYEVRGTRQAGGTEKLLIRNQHLRAGHASASNKHARPVLCLDQRADFFFIGFYRRAHLGTEAHLSTRERARSARGLMKRLFADLHTSRFSLVYISRTTTLAPCARIML